VSGVEFILFLVVWLLFVNVVLPRLGINPG